MNLNLNICLKFSTITASSKQLRQPAAAEQTSSADATEGRRGGRNYARECRESAGARHEIVGTWSSRWRFATRSVAVWATSRQVEAETMVGEHQNDDHYGRHRRRSPHNHPWWVKVSISYAWKSLTLHVISFLTLFLCVCDLLTLKINMWVSLLIRFLSRLLPRHICEQWKSIQDSSSRFEWKISGVRFVVFLSRIFIHKWRKSAEMRFLMILKRFFEFLWNFCEFLSDFWEFL